ncbi:hypothetical protein UFOVP787_125 [uncultured Caudovirales phage]|uniref:Major tropism determinant N-terminal domain-containing protein n=1 Tax=uncultured Caudovirales phage TaxID=2100421 RepID=A0A6J5P0D0_9CAUD|nr:hypothetical protein UFOVP787_125 [uncultured Caudovirales phage]
MANNVIQIKRSSSTATPTSLNAGELAYSNTSKILFVGSTDGGTVVPIGGARTPGVLTANQALVANATSGIDKIIVANLQPTYIFANGASGTANQVLSSNSSGGVYWSTLSPSVAGSDTQVQYNDGGALAGSSLLTFNKTTGTLTANNFSGNGASVTSVNAATVGGNTASTLRTYSDTVAATAYSNAMADTLSRNGSYTGNNTFGGTNTVFSSNVIVSARVSSNLMPAANATYHLGNNDIRWAEIHAANIHAVTGIFDGNVNITGNLNVAGNVVTTNVQSVIVSDPMIYLAGNNYTSDLVDIGIAANYNDGTNRHTGLFRDHVDGVWKLFYNLTQELSGNNDVDTSDASYRIATLQTYLQSGGLTTNSTSANLIANSTYSVGIVANNLTLSAALVGTSGGTGKSTMTNNAILVGNSTNGYNELSLGTSGYVLQSNGTALVYDLLDGGSF